MAPRSFPDEIDVFTVPHSRMKELVNIYSEKVQCLDFRDGREVISLLHDLGTTLYEFKSHESIENIFIMDQLKNRLKQRQIHNTAVCDCHNDNRLADVLQLVRTGSKVREQGMGERLSFCQELQRAFEEFVANFLTHMEEEEQVFQPLLVEYFEYDELKVIKDIVLKEHEHVKERHEKAHEEEPETCNIVKELRDLDWNLDFFSDESAEQDDDYCSRFNSAVPAEEISPIETLDDNCLYSAYVEPGLVSHAEVEAPHLPVEILFEIFRQLSPQDLGRCAQVCSSWNDAAYSPALWKAVYPVQWARGIWEWYDIGLSNALEDAAQSKKSVGLGKWDEDKDVDEAEEEKNPVAIREHSMLEELVNSVLPRVGHAVNKIVVDAGSGITSRLLHHALILCPNVVVLSAAYTQVDYYLFKGLWHQGSLKRLERLDLQGCDLIDDDALECLSQCAAPNHPYLSNDREECEVPSCPKRRNSLMEAWTVSSGEPLLQYCGYCTCWQTNISPQRMNHSYINSYNQDSANLTYSSSSKAQSFFNTNNRKLHSGENSSNHSRQEFKNREIVAMQSSSSSEILNPERDIEEICCRPEITPSIEDNTHQSNPPCKRLTPENDMEHLGYGRRIPSSDLSFHASNISTFQLIYLNLSGCWRVTDEGLLALVEAGAVDRLYHLNVSGCYQLTGEGLKVFAFESRALKAEELFYCNNIVDGPYSTQANGCANLCNPIRVCCRNGR